MVAEPIATYLYLFLVITSGVVLAMVVGRIGSWAEPYIKRRFLLLLEGDDNG